LVSAPCSDGVPHSLVGDPTSTFLSTFLPLTNLPNVLPIVWLLIFGHWDYDPSFPPPFFAPGFLPGARDHPSLPPLWHIVDRPISPFRFFGTFVFFNWSWAPGKISFPPTPRHSHRTTPLQCNNDARGLLHPVLPQERSRPEGSTFPRLRVMKGPEVAPGKNPTNESPLTPLREPKEKYQIKIGLRFRAHFLSMLS